MRLHTAASLPISDKELAKQIGRNKFTLYDHDHVGGSLYIFDDRELLAYVQWTTWQGYAEITAIESAWRGCGSVLVARLKCAFEQLETTSRLDERARRFWHGMGFTQDNDDRYSFHWVRR